jgi:hypothetical protein
MREKTLTYLAYVTGPAVVIALGLSIATPGSSTLPAATEGSRMLPGLKGHADDLAHIGITGPDGTLTLTRKPVPGKLAEGWALSDKGGYPVQAATIKPVLEGLLALHGVAAKTAQPKLYSRLDVNDAGKGSAARLVVLVDAKGNTLGSILLGRHKDAIGVGGKDGIYVRVSGAARSWLAEPAVTLPSETLDWIDRSVVDIDGDKVNEVVITQPGLPPLDFARDKPADKLLIRGLPSGTKTKSETPGSDIETSFKALELQDVKPADKLAGTPSGSVHLVTFSGIIADFTLTKDAGQTWLTVAARGVGDGAKAAAAITARTKGWAYEIPSDKAAIFSTKLADLVEAPKK